MKLKFRKGTIQEEQQRLREKAIELAKKHVDVKPIKYDLKR